MLPLMLLLLDYRPAKSGTAKERAVREELMDRLEAIPRGEEI